ncbi:uncharacterized protein LOC110186191 [Drosophila serrata]|uniref:uncharacterized protein LOC110186191 n=1 Tax=Drosophila serrata TaxID=7274 RepID=UPI000A1D2E13|nr:uncharacterized protein LOC110186191 [Drosophila serrata]
MSKMEPIKVPKKVNRHLLKAFDFLQASKNDFVSLEDIQNQVRWSLRNTKPVEDLDEVVLEALKIQTEMGILNRSGSMYALAVGFPGLNTKKLNKHVLKAVNYLQASESDFVPLEAIQDRVKKSLRYARPVTNLEGLVKECLRNQTELGIVSRDESSNYAMTLAVQRVRSPNNEHQIEAVESDECCIDSLTPDEITRVRKILRRIQKPLVKKKPGAIWPRAIRQRTRGSNDIVKAEKSLENGPSIVCDKCYVLGRTLNGHMDT